MGNSSEAMEVDTYNHPRLGPIKRIQESNSNQYIGYELVIENQKMYDEWVKELRLMKMEESVDEILFLPLSYTFKQTAYCGTGGIASVKPTTCSCATKTTCTRCCRRSSTGGKSNVPSISSSYFIFSTI